MSQSNQRATIARLAVLMGASCIDMMGMLMVVPLVPFYAKGMGASDTMVGVLAATHAFGAMVTAPLWGRLSDRVGRRPVVLLGLVASGIAFLVFGVTNNLWVLLLSRLVQGSGAGTVGVIQAYVTDSVAPGERAKALGWLSAASSAGVMVGPVIGSLATRLSPQAPGFIAAGLALINVTAAFFLLPEPPRSTRTSPRRQLRHALADVFRHPLRPAHRMIWIYTAGMMAFMAMNGMLALFLKARFGVTAGNIGYFYLYVGGLSVLMRAGVLGRLVDRLGDVKVLRLGAICLALGMALMPLATNVPLIALTMALVPIGTAMLFPATTAQVSRFAPPGQVGEFMGLQQALGHVARMLGPLWAGLAFQYLGAPWPFWLSALLMGAVSVLAWGAALESGDGGAPSSPNLGVPAEAVAAQGLAEAAPSRRSV
jgi:MFS family permease